MEKPAYYPEFQEFPFKCMTCGKSCHTSMNGHEQCCFCREFSCRTCLKDIRTASSVYYNEEWETYACYTCVGNGREILRKDYERDLETPDFGGIPKETTFEEWIKMFHPYTTILLAAAEMHEYETMYAKPVKMD